MDRMLSPPLCCFLGGDDRMEHAASLLRDAGFPAVRLFGSDAGADADGIAVYPVPRTKDGSFLFAPACPSPPTLAYLAARYPRSIDYAASESYLQKNAVLTASALPLQKDLLPPPPAAVAVTGSGRVAMAIIDLLIDRGNRPLLICRRESARADAAKKSIPAFAFDDPALPIALSAVPLLLNTVPFPILTPAILQFFGGCYGELASRPGVSAPLSPACRRVSLPGLPGRFFPKESGALIAETVADLLREEGVK